MFQNIECDAPVARRISKPSRGITLGNGKLEVEIPFPYLPANSFPRSKKNIICGALIKVVQANKSYQGRSANLWYCGCTQGEYRWIEISYFNFAEILKRNFEPYGILGESELRDADLADAPVGHVQHAASPREIDREMMHDFINRWSNRLAQAARNILPRPMSLPER